MQFEQVLDLVKHWIIKQNTKYKTCSIFHFFRHLELWKNFIKWKFPHCFRALGGKYISMIAPVDCRSLYYNYSYKPTHSIVLMAVADANYELIYVDTGCNCNISDRGVFF